MKGKKILGIVTLVGYLASNLLSYLGYVDWNMASAASKNKDISTQLVAVLVDDQIYSHIESDLNRYATEYIQKKYPLSKALVLKINTKEYDAPEITKLLENMYFDGLKDQSSRLIGLVVIGDIPLPVVRYEDYIFPSIYPYVDFLEQKYVWDNGSKYFLKNNDNGQAELWHGVINFGHTITSYHQFFNKLKNYDSDPSNFVAKKIWYDDFIALKNNLLEDAYKFYQNKLVFAEDLIYHRYTNFFARILQGNQDTDNKELVEDLAKELKEFGINNSNLNLSAQELQTSKSEYTPTKLLEKKIETFLRNYYEILGNPLLNTTSENIKASDRWKENDSHYEKLHIKDQLFLGDSKTNGILKSINDKLETFVDQKVEKENYAMKTTVPIYYQQTKDKKRRIFFKKYYIPEFNDIYQFFYFGRNAQTISNAQDFSLFRGTYRNLTGFVNYSQIIGDQYNPAKTKEDKTDLTYKGLGSSYDLFSTQVESNRGFNIFNTESEYDLYQKEKVHARIDWHCSKRLFGLKWKWLPCIKTKWEPIGKCDPTSDNPKDWADCENFQQFGNRVWGGATPLNLDMEKIQNQIYAFSGSYDPRSAWKEIYDIAGSIPINQIEIEASSFKGGYTYSSPTKTAWREGELKNATEHDLKLDQVWYFNVPLNDKVFKIESKSLFSLKKEKKHRQDIGLLYKYKIIPSKVKHDSTTTIQINGYSGLKYSEDSESRGYYTSIKEGLTVPQDTYSTPLLQKLTALYSQLSLLKNQFQSAANESNPKTIRKLISDSLLQSLAQISSGQAEVRGNYNDLISKNYASETKNAIEGIILRQINQKEKIGLSQEWYNEIISKISSVQSFITKEKQIADQIFMTFLNTSIAIDTIKNTIDRGITIHQGTGSQDMEIRSAWESLYQPLNQLSGTLGKINQLESCNANHSILGSMLGKDENQIIFGDEKTTACLSSLEEENPEEDDGILNSKNPLQTMLDDLLELKTTFTTHFFSDSKNPQVEIPGMNILTPERPIDSPRYLSFQGVGENEIKLIYPNLFKTEIYNQSFALKAPDDIRKALVQYLNNKVIEYNNLLANEKQKAKKLNQYYLYLYKVDKLATPTLETSVRPYQPFTYKEILEAIGGERMLNTLAELLYYQNISNQSKVHTGNIQQDIQNTKENFDINEKIEYITSNYLAEKKDAYYQGERASYSKLVIPSYNTIGYEVGYINSNGDDSVIPDQDQFLDTIEKKTEVPQGNIIDESVGDAKEAHDIQRECGFDINKGLLLYNFKTGKFDWREGLRCRLQEIRKKPFEISLSFEGSLGPVPVQESIKNDIIAPLSDSRDTYKKEFKPSVVFQDLDPYGNTSDNLFIQEIFNQTQITTQNKKISILNKTGAFNFLSLKDYGNLTVKISSTGDNCLIINGQNTCISKAIVTKNPFKNGFNIDFQLGKNTVGTIVSTLELCGGSGKCGTKPLTLSAVPGPVKSFEIGLPQGGKILAGAYTLISLKALDLYGNEIQRTLKPYTIEVDRGNLVVGGQERKSQEVNDFQNLTLLYKGNPDSSGVIKFSVKNKNGELLSSNTATLIPGKLSLEQAGIPINSLDYQIADDHYFSNDSEGNMQLNTRKAVPLDIVLRDNANAIIPITTNIILGSQNGLAKVMTLQESIDGKGKKKLTLTPLSSLFIQEGRARVYIIPGYVSGDEKISMVIPGLKEKILSLSINPGSLAKITFDLEKEKLDPLTTSSAIINLVDAWGNKIKGNQKITIEKHGPVSISPYGIMNVTNGETKLQLTANQHGGLTKIYAEAQSNDKKIQGSAQVITKKFFLKSSIESGLNIMYLNLFGNDWGNQWGYQSDNKKFSEHIITKSEKTLAITTQLVDLNKIKRTSLIFGKTDLENIDNHTIIAKKDKGKLLLQVARVGDFRVHDLWTKRKFHTAQSLDPDELAQETEKILHIYAIDQNFSYKNGSFKNQEGIEIANLDNGITFQWTNEQTAGKTVWNIIGKGQILAKALFANIDFSKSTAILENKEYEFGSLFANGSTDTTIKALFSTLNVLKSDYEGYDSIQNSDEMEKYIGFRGDFKNITSFAGGLSVGEATLPFGSEFLINIGDPILKRIDNNDNLERADYNQGLGKIIYSDTEKPIFKTIDIDYNSDGLRDLLVVYKDGEVRLQKQYQDKKFKDMGTLIISAEPIKEIFIGDVDGNDFEDIIVRNTKDQIRIYTNEDGVFDVDGKIVCLNTDTKLGEVTPTPENISKVYQFFVKDMDVDGKIDLITLDTKGYLKIFYGKGSAKNHSYLSKNNYSCDEERYSRQESSTKIVKKFGLQLNGKAIRDGSLIRRDGLTYPTDEEVKQSLNQKNNREKGIETDLILLGKMENSDLIAPCFTLDYSCAKNSYGEQFCKKYRRYNACKGCSAPVPGGPLCPSTEYREMDRQNDDQRIREKFSYEDGMCRLPSVPSCIKDGYEEKGRIDDTSKNEIVHAGQSIDIIDTAQAGAGIFDKYTKNPFGTLDGFKNHEDRAFIPINKLETPLPDKILSDKIRDISKRYTDVNGGNLENGDKVKVEVLIVNKYGTFGSGAAFFDKIEGPWLIEQDENIQAPKDIQFHEGEATINPRIDTYAYYLTNMQFSAKNQIVYSYTLTYHMEEPLFKLKVEDVNLGDYHLEPSGYDKIPDFIVQPAKDGCNKQESLILNKNEIRKKKRTYKETVVNLQKLSDHFVNEISESKEHTNQNVENKVKETKSISTLKNMPGIDSIQESFSIKDILSEARSNIEAEGNFDVGNIDIEFFDEELTNIEHTIQDATDKMCNGFSFGLSNVESCEGLPVPFNQAFLAPGNYHLMGCIPMEPLTRTLGKGLPVFHFPGTLHTPVGSIPIPWGLKGPGDGFLRAGGGVYPSQIRIYAAPTLTAQLGLAICMGPYSAGINMPSPLSDIGGNCIVTSMPLPCGKNKSGTMNKEDNTGETYYPWTDDYRETNTCELKQIDSPFKIIASTLTDINIPTSLPERTYLGGAITIDYDPITSELDATQNGLEINGVKIQEVKDIKNAILGGKQQGLQKKLVGWFDKQMQYWINNLLRFRVEVIFPDIDHLRNQISTFNPKEIGKLTSEGIEQTETTLSGLTSKFNKSQHLKTLAKNTLTTLHSKENLTALNLANGDNPFEKLQTFFNDKELVNISTQTLNVKIPRIYNEDIEAYGNYLKTREKTNKEVLDARIKIASSAYLSCETELKEIKATNGASLLGKQQECKTIQDAKNQLMQMQSKFDKTSKQIYQNIQILELYKRFPLEIYEWLHVSDKYLGEISAFLSNFFGYINYWMEVNANRFTQYVDAIITILGVVKTYQVMVDLFVDWGKKCGKCTNDTYDQYSCKLSFLCPDLPIIPIPSVKIPSLYIDLSHLNLGMDIVLPRFNFIPESIELPRLPNLPEPPQLGVNFKIDFNIPDIPQLPEPPELPELPSFIPQVKMQLPILPPAPEIPELPNQITAMVSIAKKLSKIYCIIKSGIGLVGESSVKARIEQMTQRTYNVPRVDNLNLTAYFKQTPLQGVDLQVDSYVNLQYNFDAFYSLLKGMVDTINQGTYHLTSQAQTFSDKASNWSDETTNSLNDFTDNPINLNVQVGYKDNLKGNLTSLQQALSSESEKQKLTPILALASTNTTISANNTGISKINNQVSGLIKNEQKTIIDLAQLAKSDYTSFLKTLEKKETQKPIQLSFSTNLLKDNAEAQKSITNINPIETLITTESKRLQGYQLALNSHTAPELNMTDETYKKSVNYLDMIQSKLSQWNSIKTTTYAGEQPLITKNGKAENKPLLTQVGNSKPVSHETSTTDMSPYINGILVKNHENNLVNVVHSKVNYENFPSYYQQDLNNDKKTEVITWDDHNIYIKYANDTESQVRQIFKDFYVITPQLKNKEKKYESFGGSRLFGGAEHIKLYDQNWEVKNFRLGGQTFDSLNFSWTNNHDEAISGYLMQISEEVGGLLEKDNQKGVKYLLFLPKGTEIEGIKLQIAGSTFKVKNQIGKLIYEVLYYNPSEDTLEFNLHEVPRKRQYLQLTTLKNEDNVYSKNTPRSNQLVGGRQIIGDTEPPTPKIELIRTRKPAVEDEGLDLQGYIGSYYDLQITWTDDVLVTTARIEENEKPIATENINASQGTITLKNLFFTKEQTKHYTISAKDSEGNEKKEKISLNIKIPGISIENIKQSSGTKVGFENPIEIRASLEKDIDQGNVSFERNRNGKIERLIALKCKNEPEEACGCDGDTEECKKCEYENQECNCAQNPKNCKKCSAISCKTGISKYYVGKWYDFGELIGLYTQDKKLIATVNGENGEIKIQPAYQKTTTLKVSFSKGYPVVNFVQNNKILFEIILQSEALIQKEILQGTLYPLEGESYGSFNGGEVIMKGKEPLLYIAKNGTLRSNKPLQGTYQFNNKEKTVTYSLAENAFSDSFVQLTIKVKPL